MKPKLLSSLSCALGVEALLMLSLAHAAVAPPAAYGATPSAVQLKHFERPFYAFCHFTVDTFTGAEWGSGAEKPGIFNPSQFSAEQIVTSLKAAGARGVILTCKHHDGFCLWPTRTTQHSVAASPFRNGKGDVVREFVDACRKNDFEFGVYVSPWDRNNEHYGTPEYSEKVYHEQIRELATQYGPVFEFWFDGANGGSGYYGGKGGSRSVDRSTYYKWPEKWAMLRKLQPKAVIFSDVGPDLRWVGNERGWSPDPCLATMTYEPGSAPGHLNSKFLGSGVRGGAVWCPAEVDVSIRGGWFFHDNQNPRSPENLMQQYLDSVGHGATYNLNVPPDKRGLLHENDVESLRQFGEHLRQTFAKNLAKGAVGHASNIRGRAPAYGPKNLLDKDLWSAWITDDGETRPEVTLELKGPQTFNLIQLREDIRLGLRLEGVAVDAWVDGQWKELAKAESVGACRLWRVPMTTSEKVRIRVTQSPVCPALSDFGLFLEPEFAVWVQPLGGDPKAAQKAGWKVVSCTSEQVKGGQARQAVDGKANTLWHTYTDDGEQACPQEMIVDMGKARDLTGFTYLPRQDGTANGMVDQYAFAVSQDGRQWVTVAEGEFGNLRANPVEQSVSFKLQRARYFKFVAKHVLEKSHAAVAEIGIIEAKKP